MEVATMLVCEPKSVSSRCERTFSKSRVLTEKNLKFLRPTKKKWRNFKFLILIVKSQPYDYGPMIVGPCQHVHRAWLGINGMVTGNNFNPSHASFFSSCENVCS